MTIAVSAGAHAEFPDGAAGNTAVITLNSVTAGAMILVGVSAFVQQTGGPYGNTVSDGSSYTSAVVKDFFTASNQTWQAEIWYLLAASAGTHTITVTSGGSSGNVFAWAAAAYVTGLVGSSPVDQTNSNSNAGSNSPTTGSITPSVASSLVVSILSDNSSGNPDSFTTPPSGYTNIFSNNVGGSPTFHVGSFDYLILSSSSAQNPSYATTSGSNAWAAAIANFKGATIGFRKTLSGIGGKVGQRQLQV